jgi:hypothetical protein
MFERMPINQLLSGAALAEAEPPLDNQLKLFD